MKPYVASPIALARVTLKGQSQGHSDFKVFYLVMEPKVRPYVTINHQQESIYGDPMTPSHFTLSDLERSMSRSLRLQSLISHNGAKSGPMLLLTIDRKPYMGSPMTPSLLTLSDLQRSKSMLPKFRKYV